ncbi:thioredoxin domain-containing protein 12 precursor, putative [Pediculus humanus corporis]|uniref:Thioredoxin domain-containing protein 12, putative n=1 Tax=Pediculus humanus subsp. corporis TaxID=121224 RepID=E0W0R7_PEDHC|nr:thioredoxin domain-containing protein 12 precursor, putative [Pediculus humanus corporis]EEB19223.1 thioredoxin domain-containing protein 12 precursor, putative [Pediculus humanus corporis]
MKADVKLNQGINRMKASKQPGMIMIYKSWCPVCTELKNKMTNSREIDHLNEDEPDSQAYSPDGGYIPRIFFTNPNGNILYEIFNTKGDPRYKYFYTTDAELIPNMRKVIGFFS